MPGPRAHRLRRRRFFVACEGDGEGGYAAFLQRLANESRLAIYLDNRKYRGGDPLAIVQMAVKDLRAGRIRRGDYAGQAIFLDADRRNDVPDRTLIADRLIRENGFQTIWSQPAFESLLLKHIPGCERLQPATTALALQQLQNRWPQYRKGMASHALRARFDYAAVARAASATPELRALLDLIGLVERERTNHLIPGARPARTSASSRPGCRCLLAPRR